MSHYAEYLLEREGKITLELKCGFVIYQDFEDHLYICDVYVAKDYRGKGLAPAMGHFVERIGRELGRKYVTGSVCLNDKNWVRNKNYMRRDGYKFRSLNKKDKMLYLQKEL